MEIPWIGYYHPESESVFQELVDYVRWYESRPDSLMYEDVDKVGIFFPRMLLVKKDLDLINLLIRELGKRKILPVPVFAQKK